MMSRRIGHPKGGWVAVYATRPGEARGPLLLYRGHGDGGDLAKANLRRGSKNISCRVSVVVVKSSLVESTREEVIQIDASSSSSRGYLLGEVALT